MCAKGFLLEGDAGGQWLRQGDDVRFRLIQAKSGIASELQLSALWGGGWECVCMCEHGARGRASARARERERERDEGVHTNDLDISHCCREDAKKLLRNDGMPRGTNRSARIVLGTYSLGNCVVTVRKHI